MPGLELMDGEGESGCCGLIFLNRDSFGAEGIV